MTLRRLVLRVTRDYPCRAFVEAVTDYLEGSMATGEQRRFERHLGRCEGCRAYLDQLRTTIRVSGRLEPSDVDALGPGPRAELLAAFRAFHADGGTTV